MQLAQVLTVLDEIAPTRCAEAWDNVGLLAGDPQQQVHKAMLTIDYTPETAAEGHDEQCDVIICYHPPIFDPLKRITSGSLIYDAVRRGVAICSPHTALDVAEGGANDALADALGLVERRPLRRLEAKPSAYKLVVFVPAEAADNLAEALFAAGAGRIGKYTSCSFRSAGTATFLGESGTRPAVGQAGRLERVDELRLETIVPIDRVEAAVTAIRQAHPYEEPAFDLVQLAAPPQGKGQGRIGTLAPAVDREELIARIKKELDVRQVLVAGPLAGMVKTVAACAGSCGDLLAEALSQKAELYLTGEVRHHDALRAAAGGMTVVCVLHSNSERAALRRLANRLSQALPDLAVVQSRMDRDPFVIQ
jgi:dinuclear metal center YbgI/SA1388 family protein